MCWVFLSVNKGFFDLHIKSFWNLFEFSKNQIFCYLFLWKSVSSLCTECKTYWQFSYHHNQIFDLHAGAGTSSTSVSPLPGNWLAARIADLTPDLQVLLSWGSTVASFYWGQSFSINFFHIILGLPPSINLYITCCSDCTTVSKSCNETGLGRTY